MKEFLALAVIFCSSVVAEEQKCPSEDLDFGGHSREFSSERDFDYLRKLAEERDLLEQE